MSFLILASMLAQANRGVPVATFPQLSVCDLAFDPVVQQYFELDDMAKQELAQAKAQLKQARTAARRLAEGAEAYQGTAWAACPEHELWLPQGLGRAVAEIVGREKFRRLRELHAWARGAALVTDPALAARFAPNAAKRCAVAHAQAFQVFAGLPSAERRLLLRKETLSALSAADQALIAKLAGVPPPDNVAERLLGLTPGERPFPVLVRLEDLAWNSGWITNVLEKPDGAKLLGLEQRPAVLACQQRRADATLALRWRYQSASLFPGEPQQRDHVRKKDIWATYGWLRRHSALAVAGLSPEEREEALSLFACQRQMGNVFHGTLKEELGTTKAQGDAYEAILLKPLNDYNERYGLNGRSFKTGDPPPPPVDPPTEPQPDPDSKNANRALHDKIFTPAQRERWDQWAKRSWPKEKLEAVRQLVNWGQTTITLFDDSDGFDGKD